MFEFQEQNTESFPSWPYALPFHCFAFLKSSIPGTFSCSLSYMGEGKVSFRKETCWFSAFTLPPTHVFNHIREIWERIKTREASYQNWWSLSLYSLGCLSLEHWHSRLFLLSEYIQAIMVMEESVQHVVIQLIRDAWSPASPSVASILSYCH